MNTCPPHTRMLSFNYTRPCDPILRTAMVIDNSLRWTMRKTETSRSGPSYRLRIAQDLIRNRYTDSTISLSMVAREVGLSPGHLSRLFAREAGVGFRLFVRSIRIKQAVVLLKDPKL